MKSLIISLIILVTLLLASISSAKPETLTMGPYRVSFDLNATQKYTINISEYSGETHGGIKYVSYDVNVRPENTNLLNFATVDVVFFNDTMENSSINSAKLGVGELLQNWSNSYEIYDQIIDRQSGILGVGEMGNLYRYTMFVAEYWPETPNVPGDTKVSIGSTYPWESETLSLLKTIHVELIGKPPKF